MRTLIVTILLLVPIRVAPAEQACVKYHQCINLDAFKCEIITRSSAIHRVCYLEARRYMVLWFKRRGGGESEPYHFCELGSETFKEFMAATSMGCFYNQRIGGIKKARGPFDCRDHPIPKL